MTDIWTFIRMIVEAQILFNWGDELWNVEEV